MPMVAVLQQKGGSGKTTLAVHLASLAHLLGLRTLLIDIDKQASAFEWSLAREEGSPLETLSVIKLDEAKALDPMRLAPIIKGYDFIFIDGPARLGHVTRRAAIAADVVLVPVSPGGPDSWATVDTRALLDEADGLREQVGRLPVPRVFVLNRYDVGTMLGRDAETELRKNAGGRFAGVVYQRTAFGYTMVRGETALTSAAHAAARADIERLWRSLTKEVKHAAQHSKEAKPRSRKAAA